MKRNLSELSDAYYGLNYHYEIFSLREDSKNLVESELKRIVKNRVVLDAGCGTGKYLYLFQNITNELCGIDASNEQLEFAEKKVSKKVKLLCNDLEKINLPDNTFEVIYATWVLGTITKVNKRNKVLKELKRVLKPNGVIILVENNIGGYFEEMRNRYPDIKKTKKYNNWVLKQGFKVLKELDTEFKFKNKEEAYHTFKNIYGEEIAKKAKTTIEHKVIIYYL